MATIQDEVSIIYESRKFGIQYQHIKDLISKFESSQQDRISKKHNSMIENINTNNIYRWDWDLIHLKADNQ